MIPPGIYSIPNGSYIHAGKVCPFAHRSSDSVDGESHVSAGVVRLRFRRSPAAILGAIAVFSVQALNGPSLGRLSHVEMKVLESSPTLAHGNAEPSVPHVADVSGISASLDHGVPDCVNVASGFPVGFIAFSPAFHLVAPAGFSESSAQRLRIYEGFFSAFAATFPHERWLPQFSGSVENSELSKLPPGEVDDSWVQLDRGIARNYNCFRFRHGNDMFEFSVPSKVMVRRNAITFPHPEMKINKESEV